MRRVCGWLIVLLCFAPLVRAQDETRQLAPGQPADDVLSASSPIHVYAVTPETASEQTVHLQNSGVIALSMALIDPAGVQLDAIASIAGGAAAEMRWLGSGGTTYHVLISPAEALDDHQAQFTLTLVAPESVGALQFFLTWQAPVRLRLEIRDPLGEALSPDNPQTEDGGAFSGDTDAVDCAAYSEHTAAQTAGWQPESLPTGSYEIRVRYVDGCVDSVDFRLEARLHDQTFAPITATMHTGGTFVAGLVVRDDGSGAIAERSGVVSDGRALTIPTANLLTSAQPLPVGGAVSDRVGGDVPFRSYYFQGQLGDSISATVERQSGNLDVMLALLDINGNLFAVSADDGKTGAALSGVRLRRSGTYLIVVTRYAQYLGATEGDFQLTVGGAG